MYRYEYKHVRQSNIKTHAHEEIVVTAKSLGRYVHVQRDDDKRRGVPDNDKCHVFYFDRE